MRGPPRAGIPVHCTGCTGDNYAPATTTLVALGEHMDSHVQNHAAYGQDSGIHGTQTRVSLLVGEAQPVEYLKIWVSGLLEWNACIR